MAALWSWCPTVILERQQRPRGRNLGGYRGGRGLRAGHSRTTRRTILGGILLGLAIATKMTPALTVPALCGDAG